MTVSPGEPEIIDITDLELKIRLGMDITFFSLLAFLKRQKAMEKHNTLNKQPGKESIEKTYLHLQSLQTITKIGKALFAAFLIISISISIIKSIIIINHKQPHRLLSFVIA